MIDLRAESSVGDGSRGALWYICPDYDLSRYLLRRFGQRLVPVQNIG